MLGAVSLALPLLLPAAAVAEAGGVVEPDPAVQCDDGGTPSLTTSGSFGTALEGAYVMVPFAVPGGTTRVRVKLTHDGIAFPNPLTKHTLDLGLYQPLAAGSQLWGANEFRGWGGSSRLDVCVSPDEATLGFLPGAIPEGTWAAELGVAAVAGPDEGDPDGTVNWTLQVFLSSEPAHADNPWQAAPYDTAAANPAPGWYQGDVHVHARHSNPADATMRQVFDYGFNQAGLDFLTLSDYVTTRHWDEIGRLQGLYPGKLVIRSAEVITYRGHINNHASLAWQDHRTGSIYRRQGDGSLVLVRDARPPSEVLGAIRASGTGWNQVNHPTTFPAKVPAFGNFCRGCSWEYADGETNWGLVDSFEVQTGPAGNNEGLAGQPDGEWGPNPFTPLAIEWWDRLQRLGYDITAVGSSDSHRAGQQDLLFSPIGEATTVVYAPNLSEQGIRAGILAGHAYVKFLGPHGPDLRLDAQPLLGGATVMMGDGLAAAAASFRAEVRTLPPHSQPRELLVLRDGAPYLAVPVTSAPFVLEFVAPAPGDYRLQVQRGTLIEALTNPINLELPLP